MSTRRAHERRYPKRKDGSRKYGYVKVRECDVNSSGAGCLIWFVAIASVLYFTI